MKHRIIKIQDCKTANDVLIHLDRDEHGDYIKLVCWHSNEGDDYIQTGRIDSEDDVILMSIIENFTGTAACDFANSFRF